MRSRSTNILSQIIIFTFYNQQGDDDEGLDNNDDGDQTSNIFLLLRTSLIRAGWQDLAGFRRGQKWP